MDPDLAEWEYGEYEGITTPQIRETAPGWTVWTGHTPGGETAEQVQVRADRALARIRAALADGPVVAVGHGHFSRVLAARWLGLPVESGRLFVLGPASPCLLGYEHGAPAVHRWNVPNPVERGRRAEAPAGRPRAEAGPEGLRPTGPAATPGPAGDAQPAYPARRTPSARDRAGFAEGLRVSDDAGAATAARTAHGDDVVELRLPADGAYLSVLRTATAGLAARLDFTLDEIEDLRIAVDEACALLLPDAAPGAELRCVFALAAESLSVTVTVPSRTGRVPRRNTFAWTVLSALAGDVDAWADDAGRVSVTLLKHRGGRE